MLQPSLQDCETISSYIEFSNHFYQELLGYKPEQTKLKILSEIKWLQLTQERGLNLNSFGIYLPRNQTAMIQEGNPLSLFHEYFGHGLYCEQSLPGKKLVDLEKRLLVEEKQEFQGRHFVLEDLQEFRHQNKIFQKLNEFKKQNLAQYEFFAIWTEYLLSNEFDLKEEFEKKYNSLQNEEKESINSIINFSEKYGNLATFYAQGLARRTTSERVKNLLIGIYGINAINNSKLVLLTGSKKPFSDIDLFASSDYLQPIKNDWIDLVIFNEEDFERRIKLFEIQVTYPIMNGEFVAGDKNYLEQKRTQLKEQSITEEAIQYNLKKAEEEKIASEETEDEKLKEVFSSYSQTYLANFLALKQGKKLFTKEDLFSHSHSEKFIELKGGIE